MVKILRVNMGDRTTTYEDVPERYRFLGGRGLTSTFIHDEVCLLYTSPSPRD